ncbi:MAG: acetyltransferase [Flavisolibacter sp.]|nr:acetyltransferase [Flavisolibacter sp.]
MNTATPSQKLFCKPQDLEHALYFDQLETKDTIRVRSLDLENDLSTIHRWVNHPKAKRFWQMDGSFEELLQAYTALLGYSYAHSFVGLYNDHLICQADIYLVGCDEVCKHIDAGLDQCGIHFIMAPAHQPIKGLSRIFFSAFLKYYFSFPGAWIMFGEPDSANEPANKLVLDTGFEFIKQIQLSYKQANLYQLTRSRFFEFQSL